MAKQQPVPVQGLPVRHDGRLSIAVGKSRFEKAWKNTELNWSELLHRLSTTHKTIETADEYKRMSKAKQDETKDIGGFVGGTLKGGRRKSEAVAFRQLVTLDADFARADLWDMACIVLDGIAMAVYSTHKHSLDNPRLRLVIPLSRPVIPDEYEAISRRIAADIGIDYFDDTTYEPARLMYWPSTSADAEYVFNSADGPWLDADAQLARYENWADPSYWPESSRVKTDRKKQADKQGDPLEKPGLIGAFCRAYPIEDAIATFLPDTYEATDQPGRYTYCNGSTVGGLVLYDDKFVFSHHGTDPASGKLCNAFDLVRLHQFGELDDAAEPGTSINHLPSFKAMSELAGKDDRVRIELGSQRLAEAAEEFGALPDDMDKTWMANLLYTENGKLISCIANAVIILENDPRLKGKIRTNIFSHKPEITGDLPWKQVSSITDNNVWSDTDDSSLRHFLESEWGLSGISKILDAIAVVLERNSYHPIRDYINGLDWDGEGRLDTLLIDWLGAEDCDYVRAVTRKAFTAAVARVFVPGIKFDYMLTLTGPQGIGKSSLLMKLAGKWFSDSLTTVEGKEAYEHLQGYWILEMSELNATKKAEIESIKLFLSKQVDTFRVAYGRRTSEFPRQCIFIGTTNDRDFLKDRTGNRRYWPVQVGQVPALKGCWTEITQGYVNQVWAEAAHHWHKGEPLWLDTPELAGEALRRQEDVTEDSGKLGIIREYLDRKLPDNWETMDMTDRRNFLSGYDFGFTEGEILRDRVCVAEIFEECLNYPMAKARLIDIREIHDIMRLMPGWKEEGKQRFKGVYGIQRSYRRF